MLYRAQGGVMPKVTQISIAMRNEVGALCRLCGVLARAQVNIMGLAIEDCTDEGFVRFIVDEPKKAQKTLDAAKIAYRAQEVLLLELENEMGALQRVSARLADAGINVQYAYGTADLHGRGGALVLRVSDLDRGLAILEAAQ
jgi:hypothetical protein